MKKYDSIIFDLDGTLWNASAASADGWSSAAKSHGVANPRVSVADIRKISGLPFDQCVRTIFAAIPYPDEEFLHALQASEKAAIEAFGGKVYEGVLDGIPLLAKDYALFLVSNCQDWYLKCFWDQVPIQSYFRNWDCHGISGRPKSSMIKAIVRQHRLANAIYIGDTAGDKEAAGEAGVDFGHASYGFGLVRDAAIVFRSFEEIVASFADSKAGATFE